MERIGGHPRPRGIAIPAIAILVAVIGVPLARALGGSAAAWVGSLGGAALVVVGGLLAYHRLRYRPVGFDEATGRALLGSAEVALDDVRGAERRLSTGGSAAYLEYRFTGPGRAWGRVLVLGHPVKGLDLDGLRRLARFVDLAGIEDADPTDGLSDDQRAAVHALSPTGGVSVVGKDLLQRELSAIIAALEAEARGEASAGAGWPAGEVAAVEADPSTHGRPSAGAAAGAAAVAVDEASAQVTPAGEGPSKAVAVDPDLLAAWDADDRDAEAWLAAQPMGRAWLRRGLGWLTALGVVAFCAVVGWAALREQGTSSGRLDPDTNDVVGALALLALFGTGLAYLAYTVARWWHLRRLQSDARTWLAGRGPEQAERGAPGLVVGIFLVRPPAYLFQLAAGIALCSIGSIAALAGLIAWSTRDLEALVALVVTGIGLVLTAAGIALMVRARRTRKTQVVEAVRLGGRRLTGVAS